MTDKALLEFGAQVGQQTLQQSLAEQQGQENGEHGGQPQIGGQALKRLHRGG
ncbi:hypothetical protein OMP38_27940 [Cohnella ginsengisoli]|uniref:Uncharacterized protein n=1 Tax=Cohnella ginsengisoli TaxID=425004 RepID=A0A9X4QQ72_9BACL|nr:hypothetical protein [Cohnella ginsengisoli]MDG0794241.1 hypothetical protein [Cohnella ginsengisoli]